MLVRIEERGRIVAKEIAEIPASVFFFQFFERSASSARSERKLVI